MNMMNMMMTVIKKVQEGSLGLCVGVWQRSRW